MSIFFILAIFRGWVDVFWGFGWNVGGYWGGKGTIANFILRQPLLYYFTLNSILFIKVCCITLYTINVTIIVNIQDINTYIIEL